MSTAINLASKPNVAGTIITDGDGTNEVLVFTAGSAGSRIHAITLTTDDTAANNAVLQIKKGGAGSAIWLGLVALTPPSSNVKQTDLLGGLGPLADYLILGANDTLYVRLTTGLGGGETSHVVVIGGDF